MNAFERAKTLEAREVYYGGGPPAEASGGGQWKRAAIVAGVLLLLLLALRFSLGKNGKKGSGKVPAGARRVSATIRGERVSVEGGPFMAVDTVPLAKPPADVGGWFEVDEGWTATQRAVRVLTERLQALGWVVCVHWDPPADKWNCTPNGR